MLQYRKRFYSEKFGKEIEYFYTWKSGRWGRSKPSFGREEGDHVVYTQRGPALLRYPIVFACLLIAAWIGAMMDRFVTPFEVAGYTALVLFIVSAVFCYLFLYPRLIHLKRVRDYLDNRL